MVNQRAGLEPAGLQRRNIHNLPNRAVGTQDDLEPMIEREPLAARGALASANLRRGFEQKKIPPVAVECQRAGQPGQACTNDENHGVRRGLG